ncbi:nucleoside-triphosphatase [Pelolinea submarina]|uniref:NTP hydrolase family protein n=1 Tax=Pelolinea submarina TaxID=913107 RepID=A0A347ZTE4_9CHLR|nr:nucleoside-triphosphatase [Pelolinea submarina]REG10850.1 NTP hydrolase family protein [Pelolinea submarina]BBB48575.1 nucleoside-triphosphatase [Pelolinea submarina]
MAAQKSDLTIISGQKNAGKTKLCLRLVEKLQQDSIQVNGLVSPGLYQEGHKVGILVRDIATGEEKPMAVFDPGWDPEVPEREWRFNMGAVEWGNECLIKAAHSDVLIIDELGFLEMEQNRGWTAGLGLLDSGDYKHALIVIRPDLLETACKRWKPNHFVAVQENFDTEELVDKICDYLRESA